jgi:hypothetical protein
MDELPLELGESLKQVKVVDKSGKPVTIDDYDNFMQFLMQAAATAQLVKMRKLEETKIPTGVYSLNLAITDKVFTLTLERPWISFSLWNKKGSSPVRVAVNDLRDLDKDDVDPLDANEKVEVDMKYPVIREIYLRAETGGTATVRIRAKEGKWTPTPVG